MSAALTSTQPLPVAVGEQLVAAAACAFSSALIVGTITGSAISCWWRLDALRRVVEDGDAALDLDVLLAQRRQPEGLVLLRVALGADPKEAEVEQPHRAGEHPLADQPAAPEVLLGPGRASPAAPWRTSPSSSNFSRSRLLAPGRVVEVLLAPGVVDARRLDVAVRVRADPDLLPGRRDRRAPDPLDHLAVGDRGRRPPRRS